MVEVCCAGGRNVTCMKDRSQVVCLCGAVPHHEVSVRCSMLCRPGPEPISNAYSRQFVFNVQPGNVHVAEADIRHAVQQLYDSEERIDWTGPEA
jgi:hypothetical protein